MSYPSNLTTIHQMPTDLSNPGNRMSVLDFIYPSPSSLLLPSSFFLSTNLQLKRGKGWSKRRFHKTFIRWMCELHNSSHFGKKIIRLYCTQLPTCHWVLLLMAPRIREKRYWSKWSYQVTLPILHHWIPKQIFAKNFKESYFGDSYFLQVLPS